MEEKINLSRVINDEIISRGIKASTISRRLNIPKSTLHDWLSGRRPSAKNMVYFHKLAKYFNMTIDDLLYGKKKDTPTITFGDEYELLKRKYKRLKAKNKILKTVISNLVEGNI